MSHALRIFLKLIHRRIFRKCERVVSKVQPFPENLLILGFGVLEVKEKYN